MIKSFELFWESVEQRYACCGGESSYMCQECGHILKYTEASCACVLKLM